MSNENSILNKRQSLMFEIFELVYLLVIMLYYYLTNKKVVSLFYVIPFIEHIRQIAYMERQRGGSYIDYITLLYFISVAIYSYRAKAYASVITATGGCIIHLITISTKRQFSHSVSTRDILSFQ